MPGDSFFATLHQDHEKVRDLTTTILVERDPEELRELVAELEALLQVHMYIEEHVVFPVLLEKVTRPEERILIHGSIADHHLIEHMRKTIQDREPDDERYLGLLHALDKLLAHHFDEEEGRLYTVARDNLELEDFGALQDRMKKEREGLEAATARSARPTLR